MCELHKWAFEDINEKQDSFNENKDLKQYQTVFYINVQNFFPLGNISSFQEDYYDVEVCFIELCKG